MGDAGPGLGVGGVVVVVGDDVAGGEVGDGLVLVCELADGAEGYAGAAVESAVFGEDVGAVWVDGVSLVALSVW